MLGVVMPRIDLTAMGRSVDAERCGRDNVNIQAFTLEYSS
jgi:hypothetical protein